MNPDLYLKNRILLDKSTLLNEYDGTIEYINDDILSIKKNNLEKYERRIKI